MSANYNIFQKIFAVSLASNLVDDCVGTSANLQEKLSKAIPPALDQLGPGWEVVWGPVVWKQDDVDSTHLDNAWFVAKNDAVEFEDGTLRPAYVIAIAGTSSKWAWIHEDFAISQVVNLDQWAVPGLKSINNPPIPLPNNNTTPVTDTLVTNGFGQAVYQLLNNAPPQGSPGYPQKLPDFLQSISPPSSGSAAKLVITGHSLGGALAPILAYTCLKAGLLSRFSPGNVYVYPTAGPSPGNLTFCKNFSSSFPPPSGPLTGYQYWNCNVVCDLDAVPCGYCLDPELKQQNLQRIFTIYGKAPLAVKIGVGALMYFAGGTYYPITSSFFKSKYPKPANPFKSYKPWMKFAHTEHVDAYTWEILDLAKCPQGVCSPPSEEEEWKRHPLLGSIVRANLAKESANQFAAQVGTDGILESEE